TDALERQRSHSSNTRAQRESRPIEETCESQAPPRCARQDQHLKRIPQNRDDDPRTGDEGDDVHGYRASPGAGGEDAARRAPGVIAWSRSTRCSTVTVGCSTTSSSTTTVGKRRRPSFIDSTNWSACSSRSTSK